MRALASLLCLCVPASVALAGCGGVKAADLFLLTRHGPGAAVLTLLVDEEGNVSCNGMREPEKLSDAQIVRARAIQEDVHDSAARNLSLPARPGSVFQYRLRDESGTVSFADDSTAQPAVLHRLQLFVLEAAQQRCRLAQ